MRVFEKLLAAATLALGGVWIAAGVLLGSDAGLSLYILLGLFYGVIGVVALWAVDLVVHVMATRRTPELRALRLRLAGVLIFGAIVGLVFSGGAFRVRFLLSRPSLDAFVARIASRPDTQVKSGRLVGLFWLRETEVRPGGVVRMITTECAFDDCGVVYSPGGEPPRIGEDSYSRLGGKWYLWWRSW